MLLYINWCITDRQTIHIFVWLVLTYGPFVTRNLLYGCHKNSGLLRKPKLSGERYMLSNTNTVHFCDIFFRSLIEKSFILCFIQFRLQTLFKVIPLYTTNTFSLKFLGFPAGHGTQTSFNWYLHLQLARHYLFIVFDKKNK